MKLSICSYPLVAVKASRRMVYVSPTTKAIVPPGGTGSVPRYTFSVEFLFCEIKYSTNNSRGDGVDNEMLPSAVTSIVYSRV